MQPLMLFICIYGNDILQYMKNKSTNIKFELWHICYFIRFRGRNFTLVHFQWLSVVRPSFNLFDGFSDILCVFVLVCFLVLTIRIRWFHCCALSMQGVKETSIWNKKRHVFTTNAIDLVYCWRELLNSQCKSRTIQKISMRVYYFKRF